MFKIEDIFGVGEKEYLIKLGKELHKIKQGDTYQYGLENQLTILRYDIYLLKKQKEKVIKQYREGKDPEQDVKMENLLEVITKKLKKRELKLKQRSQK
jgi:hypothetical protein